MHDWVQPIMLISDWTNMLPKAFHSTFRLAKKGLIYLTLEETRMKQLIVFLALIISAPGFGAATDIDCDCNHPSLPEEDGVSFVSQLTANLTEFNIQAMASEVCMVLHRTTNTPNYSASVEIERVLQKHSNLNTITPNYKREIANFWNQYSDQMICNATSGMYPKQHVFKRAFSMNIQSEILIDYFLSDNNQFPIDVNVIEVLSSGERSTVLDYIDKVLVRPDAQEVFDVYEILRIKRILERDFDGKRAREL